MIMQYKQKIKRVKPIICAKKADLEREMVALQCIRQEKVELVKELKRLEAQYISGVDQLNEIRQSQFRDNLETLERSVDHCKSKWYEHLKQVKEIEQREKAQIQQLIMVEKDLKSIEKLQEKYFEQLSLEERISEQKSMDEIASRNHR